MYSNLEPELPVMDMQDATYAPQFKVLKYGEKSFLRLTSKFSFQGRPYMNTVFMDITVFVKERSRQYRYFFNLFLLSVMEERSKVFETFYMVDKVRSRKNNGVGLGLSICADIAKIHHAAIELESKEQEGDLPDTV
ncbi:MULTISPECIES: ATP-binding protein [Eisenbergiella]|uniref:Cell wall metabolism sensor histidine kinase WalK n=1 Tax=Eisenbergiella porci TaxID=2652274 RepID=A0A6N7VXX9_9FIRM|nr:MULTISPECIES: ATP-binding protein [Eisenbergiella]MDY2654585.1 ATP-binding protein [Eisenbergiella porci]MSS87859.1 cell wall metabolism sensor histidine kinase WalK [Eisenbergiella porci]